MKIIYMGTPDFAVPCLEVLHREGYEICTVVTQPDKPRGRKMEMTPPEVKVKAMELGLLVYQPQSLRNEESYEYLKAFEPDFIVVAAYGKILPKNVLDIPKYACINVHGSLLPKYRGAAPIQRSVLNGDKVTGVTTMLMGEGLDTGDMLLKAEYEIGENDTAGEVFDKLAAMSPSLLIETIEKYKNGEITPIPQNESEATHAAMLSKDEAVIDWNMTADKIHNLIRGMSPWPVAYTFLQGKKLKIFESRKTDEKSSLAAGKVIKSKDKLLVACGENTVIEILSLQVEGSKRLNAKQFLAGRSPEEMG